MPAGSEGPQETLKAFPLTPQMSSPNTEVSLPVTSPLSKNKPPSLYRGSGGPHNHLPYCLCLLLLLSSDIDLLQAPSTQVPTSGPLRILFPWFQMLFLPHGKSLLRVILSLILP